MEIGLGDEDYEYFSTASTVLILVLVEIGLGAVNKKWFATNVVVLILVLVEIGLGVNMSKKWFRATSLNPCFSGNRFGRLVTMLV